MIRLARILMTPQTGFKSPEHILGKSERMEGYISLALPR
jgi:hypothetical protein